MTVSTVPMQWRSSAIYWEVEGLLTDELADLASFGDAARDVLQRIAYDYQSLRHE